MEVPRLWRGQAARYRLMGENCPNPNCPGEKIFPPRDICPHCGTDTFKDFPIYHKSESPESWEVTPHLTDITISSGLIGLAHTKQV